MPGFVRSLPPSASRRTARSGGLLLLLAAAALGRPERAQAQFIGDPSLEPYVNYSGIAYENYDLTLLKKKYFDSFGNYLVEGFSVYNANEPQGGAPNGEIVTSDVSKERYYKLYFNNLVMFYDRYRTFQSRLILGDAVRTKFTPLTLDLSRFNGVRLDAGTPSTQFTLISSRVSDPVREPFDVSNITTANTKQRTWTQYLFGGHLETQLGDVLKIGGTYVNQHQRLSLLDGDEGDLRGVAAYTPPRVVYVRLADDSPFDGSGPTLYGPPNVRINERNRATRRLTAADTATVVADRDNDGALIPYAVIRGQVSDASPNAVTQGFDFTRPSGALDSLSLYGLSRSGTGVGSKFTQADPTVAPGELSFPLQLGAGESITFAYVMPTNSEALDVSMIVANDYVVEAGHDYLPQSSQNQSRLEPDVELRTRKAVPTIYTPFARAEGNIRDGSNKQVVRFSYGLASGMAVASINAELNLFGFKVQGELARSSEYRQFPTYGGGRSQITGDAWFLRAQRPAGRFTFGAELYRIEPTYTTYLRTFSLDARYFNANPGTLSGDITSPGSPGGLPGQTNRYDNNPSNAGETVFSLVENNNDRDRWADIYYQPSRTGGLNRGLTPAAVGRRPKGYNYPVGYVENQNEYYDQNVTRPDAGIFFGLDRDNDGIPDDDRNSNGRADYAEPFLTYYSDPQRFDYGDDWNNNGVIDARELDIYPNYGYQWDTKGSHLFGRVELARDLIGSVGAIRQRGIGQGGRNNVTYGKLEYNYTLPTFGVLNLYHTAKRVQDDILNPFFAYDNPNSSIDRFSATTPQFPTYFQDTLRFVNSMVNTSYLRAAYRQVPGLNIENSLKLEFNDRLGDTGPLLSARRPAGKSTFWGLVNKIDLTIPIGPQLTILPQFKARTEKRVEEDVITRPGLADSSRRTIPIHQQDLIPIFRIDFRLTDRTVLHFGAQGFTIFGLTDLFVRRQRDLINPLNTRYQTITTLTLTQTNEYGGYRVGLEAGALVQNTRLPNALPVAPSAPRPARPVGDGPTLFMRVYAGF